MPRSTTSPIPTHPTLLKSTASAMVDQLRSNIIKDNPIGRGLDAFRTSFSSICEGASVACSSDALEQLKQEDLQNLVLTLLSTLQILPAARLLRSNSGKLLFSELPRLYTAVASDNYDLDRIKPLLKSALADNPDDVLIWDQVYTTVTESTPPPRPVASSLQQTPWLHNTSSFANSSEHRKYMDDVLKEELGPMVIKRAPCIAGRATTCWKAYREEDPRTPFVIKDSWQYTEREEEGELLREAIDKGVVNVARYYHHETVSVHGKVDDIRSNVRGGLNIMEARNYRPEQSALSPSTSAVGAPRKGRRSSTAGVKRSSSQTGAPLPPSKRSCSASSTKTDSKALPNRIHRRIILRDYGIPIYKASSRAALLAALEGCIEGHESLRRAGFLHRDISINNLMINEDDDNPSWPSFLIDLDLAIKEQRESASGARGKTGTRAFMAIGALLGEQHSFMHDLESFFWVLFWICVHCNGPDESLVVPRFEKWNYLDTEELASDKKGVIADEGDFLKIMEEYFTSYFQALSSWVNRLRRKVFPSGERWKKPSPELYHSMKETLREARKDPRVLDR
ncbi:hypothetical protein DL764_008794 [Monosporascus ibericus]|uniref:non-specific serine/threonine protein kinase n=1 Tax=Monosporascus ibericus TaxID=155417 RepID=A0A4Q4SWN6_9PEZI|nr:hypothetical protein DL764_008794 [Monosporascus ibericus]